MEEGKRKRVIEKLQKLADPNRNPNVEEAKAAREKVFGLLSQGSYLEVETTPFPGESREDSVRRVEKALKRFCEDIKIDTTWVRVRKT